MKSIQRRKFLKTAATAATVVAVSACGNSNNVNSQAEKPDTKPDSEPPKDDFTPNVPVDNPKGLTYGTLMCGGFVVNQTSGEKKFLFTQVNIDRTISEEKAPETKVDDVNYFAHKVITDINFLVHGVIRNPLTRRGVLVFEKKGPGGAEIDLKENKVINRIQPSKNHEFYGHGGYSADGKTVFATEYHEETYVGKMTVRDAKTFKVLGDFPTHGEWPHDCQFIDGGKVVAITNGGGHKDGGSLPNVAYVNVETGELIEKIEWADNPQFNAGHLLVASNGDLVVAHAMREGLDTKAALGALSMRAKGGKLKTMSEGKVQVAKDQWENITQHMNGETLSLALHGNILAATNPYALFEGKKKGVTTFWDLKKQKFMGANYREQPRGVGVTLDGKYWVITSGKEKPGAALILTKSGQETMSFEAAAQGSHVYIHDFPA